MIHATDVGSNKFSTKTGRATAKADLKKMVNDVLGSINYLEITPTELASGECELPHLVHSDGGIDMNSIVDWPHNTIGTIPYIMYAHLRHFFRRAFETSSGEHHQEFSPIPVNDSLVAFPDGRDCDPRCGSGTPPTP